MYYTKFNKGDDKFGVGRHAAGITLAAEFFKYGLTEDNTHEILSEWNEKNTYKLTPKELDNQIKQGFSGKYKYSCLHDNLKAFCIGKEECHFGKNKAKRKYNNYEFIRLGWPKILSSSAARVYYMAITYAEQLFQTGAGGRVCISHRRLSDFCGVSRQYIKAALEELQEKGLIEFKNGVSQRWMKKATEIRRLLPIRDPP
ncbi:MAG: winged helix-turn-helix domain-containing protein [bacterium]|nr:winged helix-turn-helix domain-containing protein [bacterium]